MAEVVEVEKTEVKTEEKVAGKLVSAGQPTKMDFTFKKSEEVIDNGAGEGGEKKAEAAGADSGAKPEEKKPEAGAAPEKKEQAIADPTDEQLKAYFEKQGIAFEGIDKLKEKLTTPAEKKELSPEEKEKAEQAKEKRLIDEHLAQPKATVDQFAALKTILGKDKKELGYQKEIEDLVKEGFSQEDATALANERYFQFTDEEIEAETDAALKAKLIKQRETGNKKLENKGTFYQNTAKNYLDILEKNLSEKEAEKIRLEQHSSTVEDAIKKYQRNIQLSIGQINEKDVSPIDFEVSDTALNSAKEMISDYSKFESNLLTTDGKVNLDFILPHLVKSFSMDEAVKKTYLAATDRTVKEFKAAFGSDIPPIGGTKKETGTPGKITEAGKPQVFRPVRNN